MFCQPSRGNGNRYHHKSLSDSESTREYPNNRSDTDFSKNEANEIKIPRVESNSKLHSFTSLNGSSFFINLHISEKNCDRTSNDKTKKSTPNECLKEQDCENIPTNNKDKGKNNEECPDAIPKAIIERSIRPERFDLNTHKKDLFELIAKLESENSENSSSSTVSSKGSDSKNQSEIKAQNQLSPSHGVNQPSLDKFKSPSSPEVAKISDNRVITQSPQAPVDQKCVISFPRDRGADEYSGLQFDNPSYYIDKQLANYPVQHPYYSNIQNHLDLRVQGFYPPYDVNIQSYNNLNSFGNPVFNVSQTDFMYSSSPRMTYYVPPLARVDVTFNALPQPEAINKSIVKKGSSFTADSSKSTPTKPKSKCVVNDQPMYYKNNIDSFPDSKFKLCENGIFNRDVCANGGLVERDISTVELAKDQHGSRLIQNRIEGSTPEEIFVLINELIHDEKVLVVLVGDVFGNYVIQKLLDHGNEDHRMKIISKIKGNILLLSMQMYGCRVIQKAIECGSRNIQVLITKELETHVLECIKDQNGNHVIQKCIEKIDPILLDFIIVEISGKVVELSSHPYGCRVIQRIIERLNDIQKAAITKELFIDIPSLVLDQYGNYVVQHILDHRKNEKDRDYIFNYVKENLFSLSSHKFASNVVEKCLVSGTRDERRELISEIIDNSVGSEEDVVFRMMKDAYANYVIQKMIDVIIFDKEHETFNSLVNKIKPHYPNLRKINYGKHIINKIDKICNKLNGIKNQTSYLVKQDGCLDDTIIAIGTDYKIHAENNNKCNRLSKISKENGSNKAIGNQNETDICDNLLEFPSLVGSNKVTLTSDY